MQRNPKGRLELTWMGKEYALIPNEEGVYDYAWVDPEDPRAREVKSIDVVDTVGATDGPTGAGENLVIQGDCGDALRSLATIPEYRAKYAGKVKLVYIDPPFNTHQMFEHYADQLEHSVWLTLMRDRLREVRPLLSPDASVWVHLDDAEVHHMRTLLDEEFGADNFVTTVVWGKSDTSRNDAAQFSVDQDYLLVYSLNSGWSPNRLPRTVKQDSIYGAPDGDDRRWLAKPGHAPGARTHQGMVYAIQSPFTGELMYPPEGGCWRLGAERMFEEMNKWAPYRLKVIDDATDRARICGVKAEKVRKDVPAFLLDVDLSEAQQSATAVQQGPWPTVFFIADGTRLQVKGYLPEGGTTPRTIWDHRAVGSNRNSKAEIKALFPGITPFSTPKPEALLERIITLATDPGDLVLDFFAGSGTTAAVAHKMGRRWITVELQTSTVEAFIRPRLTKVVEGTDKGGISTRTERVATADLPEGMSPQEAQTFNTLLTRAAKGLDGLDPKTIKALRDATRTKYETTTLWEGGGGFTVAKVGPSMYEVDDSDGEVFLSPAAVNGTWSRAIAGQLGFTLTPDHPVFCGVRRRQRLAVVDGIADEQVVCAVVASLAESEKAVIIAKGYLPQAADLLAALSPGSRLKKAPQDLFPKGTVN
ncbi:site-specific DNA-methyltransferase [Actinomyces sp. 594]|uniref:site-specific DNA-methyltransferase n=1 Tax=Actinomyces sp. 594 TaxID=2057793 RepID=UPI001C5A0940|nr:site-specific DNA-methyltransferase [Actinomyces sp. 594]MBW3068413.1 site-specific DNA-methyltransferase [Actinomyces sp. 594]